jgi:preprotein translocase subunit SecB
MLIMNGTRKIDVELSLEIQTHSEIEPTYYLEVSTGGISLLLEIEQNCFNELLKAGVPMRGRG